MSDATTLPAGRELDALVAEKVFGWVWKLDEDRYGNGSTSGKYRVICDPELWGADYPLLGLADGTEPARIDRPYGGQNPPHYSTASAWEVVEKMVADGWAYAIVRNPHAPQHGVKFYRGALCLGRSIFDAEGIEGRYAVAGTLPLAICRAALAAVEASA